MSSPPSSWPPVTAWCVDSVDIVDSVDSVDVATYIAATEISKLVKSKCLRLGLEEKKTLDQEFKMLSVVIQKANSRMLISRQIFPSNEVDIPNPNNVF